MESDGAFLNQIRDAYDRDALFSKVNKSINQYPSFELREGLLYTKNRAGKEVICIPRAKGAKRKLTEQVLEQSHNVLGHLGPHRTNEYVRTFFWW
ncbi:hypothetical protein PENSPDRAFT_595034, partial [Peniophora sp. CONT]